MLSHKLFIVVLFGFLLPAASYCQDDFYFRHYQVENGLSHNTVMCSLQDEKGFIWLGTKDGLNRFDGNAFKVFRQDEQNPNSIGNNYIRCLYIDKNSLLYVGTQRGLYIYDARTESFTHLAASGSRSIKDVCVDTSGNTWFIAEGNLIKQQGHKITIYDRSNGFSPTALCMRTDGSFWVATDDGRLNNFNPLTGAFIQYKIFNQPVPGTSWIEKIYPVGAASFLIGTSAQGLYLYDKSALVNKPIVTHNPDKTGIYVRDIIQTGKDEYWIATESGIYIYDTRSNHLLNLKKNYHNPYSLSDNAVYTLCRDREGGLWAGTFFGGANYYPKKQLVFQKYFPDYSKQAISGNAVREIEKDKYGNLWVGTEDAGLNKIDEAGQVTHFMPTGNSNSLSYYNIHGLLAVNDTLWVGTFEHGLNLLNIKTGRVMKQYAAGDKPGNLRSNFIFSIYQTRSGAILTGTTVGVYRYNSHSADFVAIPELSGYTYDILEDYKGVLWSATISEGIKFFDPSTNKYGSFSYNPANKNSVPNNMVNALFEDSRNRLWIATEGGGAACIDPSRTIITRYNSRNGLPSNFIFKVLEDDQHMIWITTSKGLVQLNTETGKMEIYTSANGLLNDQFNYNSGFKDETGRLFFGSVKGMISFKPAEVPSEEFTAPVYFTGFQVNNAEITIGEKSVLHESMVFTKKIELSYNQSSFSIDFAALNHTAPQMNTYAYSMEGVDTGWTYLEKNRRVYFTDLSPGKYVFTVRSANNNNSRNNSAARLTVIIMPPWWRSQPAYVLYFAVCLLLGFLSFRYYHRHLKKENQQKIDLLLFEKEKEIYDAKMKFFTNIAHEIRTPLTLIKGPLERVINKTAGMPEIKNSLNTLERNTNRLIDLTNQLLDYRKTEAGGFVLNFEEENISVLLEETFTSFTPLAEQRTIHYQLIPTPVHLIAFADKEAITKILSNLLSNAIKYADKVVTVTLTLEEKNLFFKIVICNDGFLIPEDMKEKIFEPFVRLKRTEQQGTGIGLALARSLTELHQGILEMQEHSQQNCFVLKLPVLYDHPHYKETYRPTKPVTGKVI